MLERVSLSVRSQLLIDGIDLHVQAGTHLAIVGPAGSGKTVLLETIAGHRRDHSGTIRMGARSIDRLPPSRRPLFDSRSSAPPSPRWSVRHVLVAALRQTSLDRQDRLEEYEDAVERWSLNALADRRLTTLSDGERLRVRLAQIEILRPAVLVANRLLDSVSASDRNTVADRFFRLMNLRGTTILTEPSDPGELQWAHRVAVLDQGRLVQTGSTREVYERPVSPPAALSMGPVNAVPVVIEQNQVRSAIGTWSIAKPPFQGTGYALARPEQFHPVPVDEESDLVLGVEEARYANGSWHMRGVLTGAVILEVKLPSSTPLHKGRLIPLRFDPRRFVLVEADHRVSWEPPMDVIPPLGETR